MVKNKGIILTFSIVLIVIMLVGGTYAYFVFGVNVTNGNYVGKTECFEVDYSILNSSSTNDTSITGTLFPTSNITGGLNGRVSINIKSGCNVTGSGTIYLYLGDNSSKTLFQTVSTSRCENKNTLENMPKYTTSSTCSQAGGSWVSNGSALKYAIYSSTDTTTTPVKVGYVNSSSTGVDVELYNGFTVNNTQSNYYIYIWLDGYLTDSTYTNLSFDGYIHASVLQNG